MRKGFTLVEIIVVLGIVSVLIGFSIAGISILQRSSRDSLRLKAVENIKAEITRIQTQTGRIPKENEITWGETEVIIGGTGVESRTVKVEGVAKPKGGSANICSETSQSDSAGTVYCYQITKDGYILGADKENGIIDIGTSSEKFADIRTVE